MTDILCGCGWGLLAVPHPDDIVTCPMCGYVFTPPHPDEED